MRRRLADDAGFTLIEVVVGLIVFALIAEGLASVLIGGAQAELFARNNTAAKAFTQQRIDAMRSLPYHVDAQNGQFIDLLDQYFPNVLSSTTHIQHIVEGQTVDGVYVASDTAASTHPAGPYYRISIAGSLISTELQPYTQLVYTQFLNPQDPSAAAMAPPSTYDSTVPGQDQPISPLLGVWVDTTWSSSGHAHTLTTVTEIASAGTDSNLVVSQASADAVRIVTQDYLANAIVATVGSVIANGTVSNGSQAGATATGASVNYTTLTTPGDPTTAVNSQLLGEQATTSSPPTGGSTLVQGPAPNQSVGGTGCGSGGWWWGAFGPTAVKDVSSDILSTQTQTQPVVPEDAASGNKVSAYLTNDGSNSCAGLWFSNETNTSYPPDPSLSLASNEPMVHIDDMSGFQNSAMVTGSGNVYTSATPGVADSVTATASASMITWLKVFPGVDVTPQLTSAPGVPGTPGLINVELTNAQLFCETQADGSTTATLTYSGTVVWYSIQLVSGAYQGVWHTTSFTWVAGNPDPLAGIDLSQPVSYNSTSNTLTPLSAYITGVTGATSVSGSSGVETVDAAVSITTVPTLGASYPGSTLAIQLGHLSCAAQDNRA